MSKEKISVTIDAAILADAEADAKLLGVNRSELIEDAVRRHHLRLQLRDYTERTVPALDIDSYAAEVNAANRASNL